jgi:hypothetical protein
MLAFNANFYEKNVNSFVHQKKKKITSVTPLQVILMLNLWQTRRGPQV